MDSYKLAEILTEVINIDEMKHYGLNLVSSEYDEFDGSIGVVINENGKVKKFVIEVREV